VDQLVFKEHQAMMDHLVMLVLQGLQVSLGLRDQPGVLVPLDLLVWLGPLVREEMLVLMATQGK